MQFETSKAFAHKFMEKYGIPTPCSATFELVAEAQDFAASLGGRCAVKADGLALGKGVVLCGSVADANRAIEDILVRRRFGAAGGKIVIQELLEGTEISLHALCDGKTAELFPASQDHKRALDGDRGLNTGGMGAYSPVSFLREPQADEIGKKILGPWLRGCASEGVDFCGILYPGVMLTKDGPKVLELNARFGDPETQVYLTRLESDLVEVLEASLDGTLRKETLKWSAMVSICVVMASGGYPGLYVKGKAITGLEEAARMPNTKVFHAGTVKLGERVLTDGGRVLGITAWGEDLKKARDAAYRAVHKIHFVGAEFRHDIAAKGL